MTERGRDSMTVIAAETLHSTYIEYINAGFTEEQAFELIRTVLEALIYAGREQ